MSTLGASSQIWPAESRNVARAVEARSTPGSSRRQRLPYVEGRGTFAGVCCLRRLTTKAESCAGWRAADSRRRRSNWAASLGERVGACRVCGHALDMRRWHRDGRLPRHAVRTRCRASLVHGAAFELFSELAIVAAALHRQAEPQAGANKMRRA
jgi:hypothetical protein